ncbi:divalent-cation tolerance protein CutA [Streptomyces sp. ISL-99]|uniref:divalent-cation tolerance protein CutA n=1 Tax=Streptomyces sp. ISL-99 TaxID=2819193 RepID=UPI0020351AA6|nr:divalent-cation tolerance protein CutA [Streptomyces sp. ISL-99]
MRGVMRNGEQGVTVAEWLTVLTMIDSREKALALARGAVDARLAACAQVGGPVASVYWWEGATETDEEWQVVFKTVGGRYEELEAYVKGVHDYDTPEIIATAVVRGSAEYLAWVAEETAVAGD